ISLCGPGNPKSGGPPYASRALMAPQRQISRAGIGKFAASEAYMFKRMVLLIFLSGFLTIEVSAQTTNGLMTGTVSDTTGAVVTDAEVTVTNLGTSLTRHTTTNGTGTYILPQLPPGLYKVEVSKTGFASVGRERVELEVNQSVTIDFQLGVGAASQTVEV